MKNGNAKLAWIKEQIESGKTVFFHTSLKITKITKKHISIISIGKDGGIYINGICFDYAKLTAQ